MLSSKTMRSTNSCWRFRLLHNAEGRCAHYRVLSTNPFGHLSKRHTLKSTLSVLNATRCVSSKIVHRNTLDNSKPLPPYSPPTTGILSYLPSPLVPYAELIRLDKPTGGLYLLYPCIWSTLLASTMATTAPEPTSVLYTAFLFASGAFVMRSAGCTMNDFWDRKFDAQVSRTRHRPIARGAITPTSAFWFATGQCLVGFMVLLQFPVEAIIMGVPSLVLACLYPLAKRVTNYPQAVLGLAFSWGAILGFPAMGVSLLDGGVAVTAAACLYASNVAWTILYDIVYAHQDLKDDVKAGVKGIVVRHPEITKPIMTGLGILQMGFLGGAGWAAGVGPIYYIWSVMGAAAANGWMIWRSDLRNEKECWEWFKWNNWVVGGAAVTGGLTAEYLRRYLQREGNVYKHVDLLS